MKDPVTIQSEYGDMQVVVLIPSGLLQRAYGFRPTNNPEGLQDTPRRDLEVLRALLQDALQDVDDERQRRAAASYERAWIAPPAPLPVVQRP